VVALAAASSRNLVVAGSTRVVGAPSGQHRAGRNGATVGPLVIALVLYRNGTYRTGYAVLLISALWVLVSRRPRESNSRSRHDWSRSDIGSHVERIQRAYWLP
jgi:hypothetical protein